MKRRIIFFPSFHLLFFFALKIEVTCSFYFVQEDEKVESTLWGAFHPWICLANRDMLFAGKDESRLLSIG